MSQDTVRTAEDFGSLSQEILHLGHHEIPRQRFLSQVSRVLLEFARCDAVIICIREAGRYFFSSRHGDSEFYETSGRPATSLAAAIEALDRSDERRAALRALYLSLLNGDLTWSGEQGTPSESAWLGTREATIEIRDQRSGETLRVSPSLVESAQSRALVPFLVGAEDRGLLILESTKPDYFGRSRVELYEQVAMLLGVTLVHRRTQLALRERVKELTCLYGIAKLVANPQLSIPEIMQSVAAMLPPAWLYPEIASGRIALDGVIFESPGYREGIARLRADIAISGKLRGLVEVTYAEPKPELSEGPFLVEERSLIDAIAKELALAVKNRQAEEEREKLQDQLRHADRLATIGQLSAGVAHELNEPLAGILGFAQLALKEPELPAQTKKDLEKIVAASLHGREVVRKLMLFAHQTPPEKNWVNLNLLAEDGLYFVESRCAKAGIDLRKDLAPGLPDIQADPAQMFQVLVNLTVNAIQAMPNGGELTIRTTGDDDGVQLVVQDSGVGMSLEIKDKVFIPFFTTKDVGEGTGLGLAVVDGIVSSHGGSVEIESEVGVGTTFIVRLPFSGSGAPKSEM